MFILREDGSQLLGPLGFNAQPQADNQQASPLPLASVKAAQKEQTATKLKLGQTIARI